MKKRNKPSNPPRYAAWRVERLEGGKPHYIHAANCPNYCDYACNGAKGFTLAERIAKQESKML